MSNQQLILRTVFLVAAMASAVGWADVPLEQSKDLGKARIQPPAARAAALKVFDGSIVGEELEYEKGGSGLRYSFDIRKGSVTHEVGIDAKTGAVLENSIEGTNPD